jgi:hypothetical protein
MFLPRIGNLLRMHAYKGKKNIHFSFRREKLPRTSIIIEINADLREFVYYETIKRDLNIRVSV